MYWKHPDSPLNCGSCPWGPTLLNEYNNHSERPWINLYLQALERQYLYAPNSWNQRRQWHPTPVLLPGTSHGQRSLVGCSPWGRKESDTTERLHFGFSLSCTGEGNGHPLQCSCLENPRDGGAWWAAIYGVAPSRTQLKQLSSSGRSQKSKTKAAFLLETSEKAPFPCFSNLWKSPTFLDSRALPCIIILWFSLSYLLLIILISFKDHCDWGRKQTEHAPS